MDKGNIQIGLSISLIAAIVALVALGAAFADIKKDVELGVKAYNTVQSIDVIELKIDTLISEVGILHTKIDGLDKDLRAKKE